jgi:pyridoxamine 5'-phosphate oxidase
LNDTASDQATADPIARFGELFAAARQRESADPTAAALATAGADGRPSVRTVLVKEHDARGFRFYTNLGSRKSQQLAANPYAALCFHWPVLAEQVRIEGAVTPLDTATADSYFAGRPRESQLGAWASRQSEPLVSREELAHRVAAAGERFAGGPVPRPPFWGGYLLTPERIEFWSARDHRLHDRELYLRAGDGWHRQRLYP